MASLVLMHPPALRRQKPANASLAGFEGSRIFRRPQPPGGRTEIPAAFKYPGCSFPADAGRLFNPTERRAELAERDDLLFLFFAQDIAQVDGGYSSRLSNVVTSG
jgi:hypothetical protein